MLRIGTASWSLPTEWQDRFPEGETHLHRYAQVLDAVEINRTFRKTPRPSTFERWRDRVPEDFRFSVKLPRAVTHDARLEDVEEPLEAFLGTVDRLGPRLGPLLIQLPPSLAFDRGLVEEFLALLRRLREGPDVLEPRHESWFDPEVAELLAAHRVARVAADPPRAERDGRPAGFSGLAYFRLHGRPRTYYSAYREGGESHADGEGPEGDAGSGPDGLAPWADRIRSAGEDADEVWVVFDNTAAGEGTGDALALKERLEG